MFSRLAQVSKQLARPLSSLASSSSSSSSPPPSGSRSATSSAMASATSSAQGKGPIRTAACLIIGDEVLGGKTVDTNSAYMARFCFNLGINLRRIEVIGDEEDEIVEATRRMSRNYDFVVTSGGIGPTHDDITYQSIAKAFGLPIKLHEETWARMRRLAKPHKSQPDFDWETPSAALAAKRRMAELPLDDSRPYGEQAVFVDEKLWVPVSIVNGNVHILPGVPRLFEALLEGLRPRVVPRLADPNGNGSHRILVSTPMAESAIAGYLTELARRAEAKGIKVGSYPRWGKPRNTVTLVGRDLEYMESLVPEVEKAVQGRRVQVEGEDDALDEEDPNRESGTLKSG